MDFRFRKVVDTFRRTLFGIFLTFGLDLSEIEDFPNTKSVSISRNNDQEPALLVSDKGALNGS